MVKSNMRNRELSSRAIPYFSAKLYNAAFRNGRGGRTTPPLHWEGWRNAVDVNC